MRSSNEIFYDLGFGFAALLAATQDPNLENVSFAKLTLTATIFPGIMAIATIFLLPESPVYLASCGKMAEAKEIIGTIASQNKVSGEIDFEEPTRKQSATSTFDGIKTVFGRRYLMLTCVLAYSTLIIKLYYYGGIYTQPLVLTKGHGISPGWEIALGGPSQMVGAALATVVVFYFRRQRVMIFAMFMAFLGIFCFGFAGSSVDRGFLLNFMYHFGSMSFYWVEAMAIIVLSQLAVDMYPTRVASTSGAFQTAAGRVGCVIAPMLFEGIRQTSGHWELFCYVVAGGCAFASLLFIFAWSPAHDSDMGDYDASKADTSILGDAKNYNGTKNDDEVADSNITA